MERPDIPGSAVRIQDLCMLDGREHVEERFVNVIMVLLRHGAFAVENNRDMFVFEAALRFRTERLMEIMEVAGLCDDEDLFGLRYLFGETDQI